MLRQHAQPNSLIEALATFWLARKPLRDPVVDRRKGEAIFCHAGWSLVLTSYHQSRVRQLERTLGRKSLEIEILKDVVGE